MFNGSNEIINTKEGPLKRLLPIKHKRRPFEKVLSKRVYCRKTLKEARKRENHRGHEAYLVGIPRIFLK